MEEFGGNKRAVRSGGQDGFLEFCGGIREGSLDQGFRKRGIRLR